MNDYLHHAAYGCQLTSYGWHIVVDPLKGSPCCLGAACGVVVDGASDASRNLRSGPCAWNVVIDVSIARLVRQRAWR